MKTLLTAALAAALCAPAFAQKMGSTNSEAPTLKQSISIGDASMSLNYTAITWAEGKTMKAAMDKDKGSRYREFINNQATRNPLAKFKTTIDCKCGGLTLEAGEYDVYYTISDDCSWSLNFAHGDKVKSVKLDLQDTPMEHSRLVMSLHAADKGAGTYIGFGMKSCMLTFTPTKKSS